MQAAIDPFLSITARLKNKNASNLGPSNQGASSEVDDDPPIVRQDNKIKPKAYYTPQPELIQDN